MTAPSFPIPLHDASLMGYSKESDDNVTISIIRWDETPFTLRFLEVVLFKELVGDGDLESLVEFDDSELLSEVRQHLIDLTYSPAETNRYRHYRLLDVSSNPVLDIVCTGVVEV